MTAPATLARPRLGPGRWSLAALVLAGLGVLVATWFIAAIETDPAGVLWPLVVAPVFITAVPAVVPARAVRIGALVAQAAWCFVTGFSIGFLLLPALIALAVATATDDR